MSGYRCCGQIRSRLLSQCVLDEAPDSEEPSPDIVIDLLERVKAFESSIPTLAMVAISLSPAATSEVANETCLRLAQSGPKAATWNTPPESTTKIPAAYRADHSPELLPHRALKVHCIVSWRTSEPRYSLLRGSIDPSHSCHLEAPRQSATSLARLSASLRSSKVFAL